MLLNIFFLLILYNFFGSGYGKANKDIVLANSAIKNDIFYVSAEMSFNIVFENVNVGSVSCKVKNIPLYKSRKENLKATGGDIVNTFFISNINNNSFGPWDCEVHTAYPDKKTLHYYFIVKNSEHQGVKIKVGYSTLDFHDSNSTTYRYSNGEFIDWSCSSNVEDITTLYLEYHNATGALMFESQHINTGKRGLRFRQLMTSEHNSSYVDCIHERHDNKNHNFTTYLFRTTFLMEDDRFIDQYITIKINGIKIKTFSDISENTYLYIYKYLYGEKLTIIREKVKESGHIVNVNMTEDIRASIVRDIHSESMCEYCNITIDTTYLGTSSQINYEYQHSSENFRKSFALYLNKDYDFDPFVIGLQTRNILYQYTESNQKWQLLYAYSPNNPLNLTCSTNERSRKITWKNESEEEIGENVYGNMSKLYLSGSKNSYISCHSTCSKHPTNITTINLTQSPVELSYGPDVRPGIEVVGIISNSDNNNPILMYVGLTIVGLLMLIAIAFITYWYKKHISKEGLFRIFHNESTTLYSRNQAENNEYIYIRNSFSTEYGVSVANTMYCSSGPSRNSGVSSVYTENHYSEIDEFVGNRNHNIPAKSEPYENTVIKNDASINEKYINLRHKDNMKSNSNMKTGGNSDYSNEILENVEKYVNLRPEYSYVNKINDYAN